MRYIFNVLMCFMFLGIANLSLATDPPTVSLQFGPAGVVCLEEVTDVQLVNINFTMEDFANTKGSLIAYSQMVQFDPGLKPAGGAYEADVCLAAMQDSCCNSCNGFQFHGTPFDTTNRVYQFAYAASPSVNNSGCNGCNGICGSSCDGRNQNGTYMKFYTMMDMDYWLSQAEGTYYPKIRIYDTGLPGFQNIYTCCDAINQFEEDCGGTSGFTCNCCGGLAARLGWDFGSVYELTLCVNVDHDTIVDSHDENESLWIDMNEAILRPIEGDFSDVVETALTSGPSERPGDNTDDVVPTDKKSWGNIKRSFVK